MKKTTIAQLQEKISNPSKPKVTIKEVASLQTTYDDSFLRLVLDHIDRFENVTEVLNFLAENALLTQQALTSILVDYPVPVLKIVIPALFTQKVLDTHGSFTNTRFEDASDQTKNMITFTKIAGDAFSEAITHAHDEKIELFFNEPLFNIDLIGKAVGTAYFGNASFIYGEATGNIDQAKVLDFIVRLQKCGAKLVTSRYMSISYALLYRSLILGCGDLSYYLLSYEKYYLDNDDYVDTIFTQALETISTKKDNAENEEEQKKYQTIFDFISTVKEGYNLSLSIKNGEQ